MFGMQTLSSSLEKMSGGKLEQMLRRVTSNPISSIALGAIITIAVQSSSATTVMLVGLVNSGMMQFSETIYVIFGANIGTTLTSWILSLSGIESQNTIVMLLKPEYFSLVFAFIGIILIMFVKRDSYKNIGNSLVGFAILMYGMEFMKEAVTPLSQSPEFANLLLMFSNPILGVLVGLVFTAIIQSSAASIGILQALALTGSVTYGMAIPI
ncbi:MAG: Na/Pi cotransporter family protein, partial [Lachnospiraceae bacterium]